jgi:uncharacterized protein YqgC (DUF456 family)
MTALLWVVAVILIVVGLAGVVLPAVPGTILVFAGLVVAASADGFMRVGYATLTVLGVLAAASYGIDFVAAALGAGRLGASRRAMIGAGLGTVLGLFFSLTGQINGPIVGAVLGEFKLHRDVARAGKAGVAAWIGFALGMAVKVALVFVMIGIFIAAFFLF